MSVMAAMVGLLQWGRNLIVAEGITVAPRRDHWDASMGPQLDSCGRMNAVGHDRYKVHASMGPQLDSCGRAASRARRRPIRALQWGRNLIVAEGIQPGSNSAKSPASMGPQLDSCGRHASRRAGRRG